VVLDRAQSPLRVAARRADGGDRSRARRAQAVGQGACGQGRFSPAYLSLRFFCPTSGLRVQHMYAAALVKKKTEEREREKKDKKMKPI